MTDLDKPLDPRWVDVEFEQQGKPTGCLPLPSSHRRGEHCPLFGEAFRAKVIPRSDWRQLAEKHELDYARDKSWQYDQGQEGTCTGNAEAGGYSYVWNRTFGKKFAVAPSPISTYRFCANGPNTGSTTSCIMRRGRDHGHLLIDTPEHREILRQLELDPDHVLKATGYYQRFPSGWEETAREFRMDEHYELETAEEFFTALLLGFDILYGRSGHAIHGVDLVWRSGTPYCKYDNSWGSWGDNGFGYDSIDYIIRTRGVWGAYAFRSIVLPRNADKLIPVPPVTAA